MSKTQYEDLVKPQADAIICIGQTFSQEFLKKELIRFWIWKRTMDLVCLGRGFYSVTCSSIQETSRILVEGPWFIMASLVWIQPWQPGFKPSKPCISSYLIWMNLPKLPLEFFWKHIPQMVGNSVGKTKKINAHYLEGEPKRFVAVCVLMGLTSVL